MTVELNVKGYTPLTQSMSNTDTEDENNEDIISTDPKDLEEINTSNSPTMFMSERFLPLDETNNIYNRTRNGRSSFAYSNDNIPIMILDNQTDELWKRRDMPPLRRFCLIFFSLLCVFAILIFLYVIPCNKPPMCPPKELKSSLSWDKTLDGIEILGKITVIPDDPFKLIFLLRGQQFSGLNSRYNNERKQIPINGGGILSIKATDGTTLWWVKLKYIPTNIDCTMIDTDGSGKPDCLVSGLGGLLVSIDPIAGTIHWNSEVHTQQDLPLMLSDIDKDGINDLITIEETKSSHNIVLLSGKTGQLVGREHVPDCYFITLIDVDKLFNVSFKCYNSEIKMTTQARSLVKFLKHSDSLDGQKYEYITTSKPIIITYPKKASADSWDLTPYHRLYVQNQGNCLKENCQGMVNLTLRHDRNETHMWNHVYKSTFISEPVILDTSTQNYTTGFALKFWQWIDNSDTPNFVLNNHKLIVKNVTERVTILVVSNIDVNEINASQSEIVQICQDGDCQPNLYRQAHSLLIVDLNNDGIFELISYRSTYSIGSESPILTSKVQIVKLDGIY